HSPSPEIYTLSLHDALPISCCSQSRVLLSFRRWRLEQRSCNNGAHPELLAMAWASGVATAHSKYRSSVFQYRAVDRVRLGSRTQDRKSTRLNSSHVSISYAV